MYPNLGDYKLQSGNAPYQPQNPPLSTDEQAPQGENMASAASAPGAAPGAGPDVQQELPSAPPSDDNFQPGAEDPSAPPMDEEKAEELDEDITPYIEGVGVTSMGDLNWDVELQVEGQLIAPSKQQHSPTFVGVVPQQFNPETAAKRINKATKGWFKNKASVRRTIALEIGAISMPQRVALAHAYKVAYKVNLAAVVTKYCTGPLRELLNGMLYNRDYFHAKWIGLALKKKDNQMLTLFLCTLTAEELAAAQLAYNAMHKKVLLSEVTDKTSNWFHTKNISYFLQNILKQQRPGDNTRVDMDLVGEDAMMLSEAATGKKTDKKAFINIFTQRSLEHLAQVAVTYKTLQSTELKDVISKSFKEASETGYACEMTLLFATRRAELYSDLLKKALKSPGPKYEFVSRFIVDRCEVDLGEIIQSFGKNGLQVWLDKELKGKVHGYAEYHTILCMLCGFSPVMYPPPK